MRILAFALAVACGPAQTRPVWTGDVSEAEFRRMHELREGASPALTGEEIEIDGIRAYVSVPADGDPSASVLVIHEWWGLNDHVEHWTDRMAAEGYAALAIDLFGGEVATTPERAMELVRGVDETRALETIARAMRFMREDGRFAAADRRAVIGWCFGGGWSLRAGLDVPGFDAVVMYYGRPITEVDRLRELRSPLLAIFGDRDTSIPPARVDEFESALRDAGAVHGILRFDADHAFANPSNPHYDERAAGEAWQAVREFLQRSLRGAR
jgi:carboxymethylenebutenolidase